MLRVDRRSINPESNITDCSARPSAITVINTSTSLKSSSDVANRRPSIAQWRRLFRRAIIRDDLVAPLKDVQGHRSAHNSRSDKPNLHLSQSPYIRDFLLRIWMYRGPVPAERIAKQYPAPTVSTECANTICTVAIVAVKSRGWEGCSMSANGMVWPCS